jgi:small subunit ribosomal protein S2
VKEARKLGIPTVCLIDTDSDPDFADIPIPGNDDSMRSIETIVTWMADAVEEGLKGRRNPTMDQVDDKNFQRRSRRPAAGQAATGPEPGPLDGPEMELAAAAEKDHGHGQDTAGDPGRVE